MPSGYTPFRFQGSWYDANSDLSWVVTRWYAPTLGRFVSEDTLLGEPRVPDSRHLYAYAAGEPVGAWDPTGEWPWEDWVLEQMRKNDATTAELERCKSDIGECVTFGRVSMFAKDESKARYPISIRTDGMGDAYRHCLWQCGLTYTVGARKAQIWGDLHEARGIVGAHERLAQRMDLHNNAVARDLAMRQRLLPWLSWTAEAKVRCRGALSNGSLWILVGDRLVRADGRPIPLTNRFIS